LLKYKLLENNSRWGLRVCQHVLRYTWKCSTTQSSQDKRGSLPGRCRNLADSPSRLYRLGRWLLRAASPGTKLVRSWNWASDFNSCHLECVELQLHDFVARRLYRGTVSRFTYGAGLKPEPSIPGMSKLWRYLDRKGMICGKRCQLIFSV
jgi:hypothetical protein